MKVRQEEVVELDIPEGLIYCKSMGVILKGYLPGDDPTETPRVPEGSLDSRLRGNDRAGEE